MEEGKKEDVQGRTVSNVTEGRRSRKEEIHPLASRCLFQLSPHKLTTHTHTHKHTHRHPCQCQDCSTDCLRPVGVSSVLLPTAAGHDRVFISQCQADTRQQTNTTLLQGDRKRSLLCKPYNITKQTGREEGKASTRQTGVPTYHA